jgi:hypothetical protein
MKKILLLTTTLILNISLLKAISPAIVIEPKTQGSSISFKLSAKVDNSNISIDWGDGNIENYILGIQNTTFSGESLGTEIKIYGSLIAEFRILQIPLKRVNFEDNSGINNVQIVYCQLDSLGLGNNSDLDSVVVPGNNLHTLKVDGNTSLVHLEFSSNSISKINLSLLTKLENLIANTNNLSSIDLSHNNLIKEIDLQYNLLNSIDLSNLIHLKVIHLYQNNLEKIDVTKNTLLTDLVCSYNSLSSIDVSNNPLLIGLGLGSNNLETVDVSNNPELTYLNCRNNKLYQINLSNNKKLQTLYLSGNQIYDIDLSEQIDLQELDLADNLLNYIEFTNNTKLWSINLTNNIFRIALLPLPQAGWSDYQYMPQQKIKLAYKQYVLNDMIDLRSEFSRNGNKSVYTWKNDKGTTLLPNVDYSESSGIFSFIKLQEDSVYCEITNSLLPNFVLETSKFKVITETSIETLNKASFALYPNPFDDRLIIKSEVPINKVEVYTSLGMKVLEYNPKSSFEIELTLQNLKSGLYLMNINGEFKSVLKK